MSRRRAAALGGLALLFGALAAADVAGREAALREGVGPPADVLVARTAIPAGARIDERDLAVRRVPARFAPDGSFSAPAQVAGARAAVAVPPGTDLSAALLRGAEPGAAGTLAVAGPAERIARVVVVGDARELPAGSRADVLVTREAGGGARTRLALRDAEVVSAAPAPAVPEGEAAGLPRVTLALRVTLGQALDLVAAQNGARELRALARPPSAGSTRRP